MTTSLPQLWIAQINPTVGAVETNQQQMLAAIAKAKESGSEPKIILFSELVVCGYPPKDLLHRGDFIERCLKANEALIAASDDATMIIWGNIKRNETGLGKPLFNAALAAHGGKLVGQALKNHLVNYDVFNEARYFEAGTPQTCLLTLTLDNGKKCAVTICEDIWSHPALKTQDKSLISSGEYANTVFDNAPKFDLLLNLSASPFTHDKAQKRLELLKIIAAADNTCVAYCNQIGANDDILFDGSSSITQANGVQDIWPSFKAEIRPKNESPKPVVLDKLALLHQGLLLGIQDYFRKTGFQRAIVGLSGGIDSAVCAVLLSQALGPENVDTVMMPGPYSSPESITDSIDLSDTTGFHNRQLSIRPLFDAAITLLNPGGQPIGDLAEQNLQARLRGLLLMTLSNRENKLLIATSNKSELAMGYSTLYGDSCGALAPLGDLYKTEVYELARYLNTQHGQLLIPENIIEKAPSAELAPNQKDEDSLGPYAQLDTLLKTLLENEMRDPENKEALSTRQRIDRNEFKRQQGPVILRVSSKAFGSGRQYLISQSS